MMFEPLTPRTLLLTQLLATAMMAGIIWFVQIVHYPLFLKIPTEGFVAYEQSHAMRTGFVVAPLMLIELGAAIALLLLSIASGGKMPTAIGLTPLYLWSLGCLALIWASTFLIQVPLHHLLEQRPDAKAMELLVSTNWIRTILWSIRLGLLAFLSAGRIIF
ncbi:MAG: hypothetical protein ORN23_03900 [Chthoniobacterales bacterium]|nr:hypothetical protein [Chthoniobacterales bacterium]